MREKSRKCPVCGKKDAMICHMSDWEKCQYCGAKSMILEEAKIEEMIEQERKPIEIIQDNEYFRKSEVPPEEIYINYLAGTFAGRWQGEKNQQKCDIEYIRADKYATLKSQNEKLVEALKKIREGCYRGVPAAQQIAFKVLQSTNQGW